MKPQKTVCIIGAIVFALCSLCCERIHNLSEKETNDLYVELKQDVQSGVIWTLEPTYFHQENELADNLEFLKSATNKVLSQEDCFTNESGMWYDKKSYCKIYTVQCQLPLQEEGRTYTVEKLTIAKYYNNGSYKIWLYYRGDVPEEEMNHYIEVVMQ